MTSGANPAPPADAFYVAVAKELGIPLVTFDKEQLNRPAGYATTLHP
jgi:predicted nucleic acid-binding protein